MNDEEGRRLARLTMLRADALARGYTELAIVYGWSVIDAIAAVLEANIGKLAEPKENDHVR